MEKFDFLKIINIYYGGAIENIKEYYTPKEAKNYIIKKIAEELKMHQMAVSYYYTIEKITSDNNIITDSKIEDVSNKDIQMIRIQLLAEEYLENNVSLREKIINYRIKHKLTQAQFADKCGVCFTMINRIENNYKDSHTKTTLGKIYKILDSDKE